MEWLENFVVDNKIKVARKNLLMCFDGIRIMRQGEDPTHDERHIFALVKNAFLLIGKEKLEVDITVLLLAICWHDVWTAKSMPSNLGQFLKEYIWDGVGSMIMWNREAKKRKMDEKTRKAVAYAIRQHPAWHIGGHKSLEAKILWDVDNLETWNWERVGVVDKKREKKEIRNMKLYYRWFMRDRNSKRLYFDWTKKEFEKRKKRYLKKVEILMKKF